MKSYRNYILILVLLLVPMALWAGGMSSGGTGRIIKDSDNAWFVQNTKVVNYCIAVDPKHFSLFDANDPQSSMQKIEQRIAEALQYWKNELPDQSADFIPIKVGTQEFRKVDCSSEEVDLRFQLGRLWPKQTGKIGRRRDFIGVTVRESYDRKLLRGRGFIYFSADSGPHRMRGDILENPWRQFDGHLLRLAAIHELGHVFGIHHELDHSIMDERLIYALFSTQTEKGDPTEFEKFLSEYQPSFFKYKRGSVALLSSNASCGPVVNPPSSPTTPPKDQSFTLPLLRPLDTDWGDKVKQFFGIPQSTQCTRFEFGPGSLKVFSFKRGSAERLEGEAHWMEMVLIVPSAPTEALFWMPDEQSVFDKKTVSKNNDLLPRDRNIVLEVHYVSSDKKIKRTFFLTGPRNDFGSMNMVAVVDGLLQYGFGSL